MLYGIESFAFAFLAHLGSLFSYLFSTTSIFMNMKNTAKTQKQKKTTPVKP